MEYFDKRGYVYTSRYKRYSSLIIGLIFLILSVIFIYFYDGKSTGQIIFFSLMLLVPTSIYLGQFGRRVEIDMSQSKLTTSYFNFSPKSYDLRKFMRFEIINYKALGIFSNGRDIKIVLDDGAEEDHILLFSRINRKKVVNIILTELTEIMNKEVSLNEKNKEEMPF